MDNLYIFLFKNSKITVSSILLNETNKRLNELLIKFYKAIDKISISHLLKVTAHNGKKVISKQ